MTHATIMQCRKEKSYPVPHWAPVFLLFLRIQIRRIRRVRSNAPPATHRMMMTVSIFTSSRTMMLVLFFAALSETSEINLFMIKRISCTVDYRSAGPLLSFCSIEELLSLGTKGSVRGPNRIMLWCMIKSPVPCTLQVFRIPRDTRRTDIVYFIDYLINAVDTNAPHKYSIKDRKLHVLCQQAYSKLNFPRSDIVK